MAPVLDKCELAIICPVLNCLDYTRQFLRTIQTKRDYRLIFINNGSTDGTAAFFSLYSKDKNVIVNQFAVNRGVAYAWNLGIEQAIEKFDSKYFFIPNNDVLLRNDTIDRLIPILDRPEVALVSAHNVAPKCAGPDTFKWQFPSPDLVLEESPDFSCFMLKKSTTEKVGFFDEKFFPAYFEDNDYHRRINLAGLKAYNVNQAIYYHFGSQTIKQGEDIRRLSNANYLKNKDYYILKWGGEPGQEVFDTPFNAGRC